MRYLACEGMNYQNGAILTILLKMQTGGVHTKETLKYRIQML
jgi:hypothetical protein